MKGGLKKSAMEAPIFTEGTGSTDDCAQWINLIKITSKLTRTENTAINGYTGVNILDGAKTSS